MNLESIRIALQGLAANRLRSALTMLGILIGVGAVIVLVAVGTGTQQAAADQLSGLGSNTLTILNTSGFGGGPGGAARSGTSTRKVDLTKKDVEALEDVTRAPDVAEVVPSVTATARGTYEGNTYQPGQFLGTTANYESVKNTPTSSGSFFTDADVEGHAKVVVLGKTVVTKLFGVGVDPIGKKVKFGNAAWTVIGVLESKGSNGFQDQDDIALAPLTAVQDTLTGNTGTYSNLTVQAKSAEVATKAQTEVTTILNANHKVTSANSPFQVLNQTSLLATQNEQNRLFTVLLGAVAAISLLVGGIGVMNIMLVTVTERTREIGIRKAIGAGKSHILAQFLVESVLVSVLGGLLGVIAGLIGSQFEIVGVTPVVAPYSVFLAFGVAVAVGLFFGIYPANRAASLRPIDALRYE
jgi:putative ABC transport system permease protein